MIWHRIFHLFTANYGSWTDIIYRWKKGGHPYKTVSLRVCSWCGRVEKEVVFTQQHDFQDSSKRLQRDRIDYWTRR